MPRTPKQRIPEISYAEVMWAAGFFEGEGHIGQRSVGVSQVNLWPLERLKKHFGGSIGKEKRENRREARPLYQWNVCGAQGRDFADAIYPHLSPRRQGQIDDKFITWPKFKYERRSRATKQAWHNRPIIENKDPVTGRFRCLKEPNQESSPPSEMLKAS